MRPSTGQPPQRSPFPVGHWRSGSPSGSVLPGQTTPGPSTFACHPGQPHPLRPRGPRPCQESTTVTHAPARQLPPGPPSSPGIAPRRIRRHAAASLAAPRDICCRSRPSVSQRPRTPEAYARWAATPPQRGQRTASAMGHGSSAPPAERTHASGTGSNQPGRVHGVRHQRAHSLWIIRRGG